MARHARSSIAEDATARLGELGAGYPALAALFQPETGHSADPPPAVDPGIFRVTPERAPLTIRSRGPPCAGRLGPRS